MKRDPVLHKCDGRYIHDGSSIQKAWKNAYYHRNAWSSSCMEEIYDNLVKLGDSPTADDINHIIGNSSWTSINCDVCGRDKQDVVELGQEADYEATPAYVCYDCAKKVVAMFGRND